MDPDKIVPMNGESIWSLLWCFFIWLNGSEQGVLHLGLTAGERTNVGTNGGAKYK